MEKDNRISLIVCDMDGTLLGDDKTVPEANRDAMMRAKAQGIRFSICTGRIQPMTDFYLKDLDLDTPVITANGALIWDPVKKEVLWDLPMDHDEMLRILRFCKEHSLDYCALTMEKSYFSPDNIRRQRFEQYNEIATANGFPAMELCDFDESFACMEGQRVYKLLIYDPEGKQTEFTQRYLDTLKMTGYTSSEKGLLDISHRQVNKGYGLMQLARLLDIPLSSVCAMGDYENDIPMLECCGYPVAMGNGCEEIKEKADFVTKTNQECGVAWAMEHFLKL